MKADKLVPASELTEAQRRALRWLYNRGGDGMFDRNGVLLARGELAGVMRSTWNALRDHRLVTITGKRVAVTMAGHCQGQTIRSPEADTVEDDFD